MNVIVCIKQVPGSSVPMEGENGVLDRSRGPARLNPRDLYAIEAALRIARETGGQVTALTMGPESATDALKTALSMGADRGVLLSDRAFAGADVYATAYTLAQGIRSLGEFDVVVCGQQTTDGDTAQLPFSLAVRLGIPALGWVKYLEIHDGILTVLQELSGGTQKSVCGAPCLLAVGEGIGTPRIPTLRDQLGAKKKPIQRMGLLDLPDTEPEHYGLKASPTRVVSACERTQERKAQPRKLAPDEAAAQILHAVCSEEVRYG